MLTSQAAFVVQPMRDLPARTESKPIGSPALSIASMAHRPLVATVPSPPVTRLSMRGGGLEAMRAPSRSRIQLHATSRQEDAPLPPLSVERNLRFLEDLRNTPTQERYEKLDALPVAMRRRLFESGETGDLIVGRLTQTYDWAHFRLNEPGIAGLYPYALLAKFPYLCAVGDDGWIEVSESYDKVMQAGFTVHALHEDLQMGEQACNRVLLFHRDHEAVISVRGTQGDQDWDINLDFFSKDGRSAELPGRYHGGYLQTFEKLWPRIESELKRLQTQSGDHQPLSIGIVGHSMGGVLCMMLAQRLQQEGDYTLKKVVTLGGVRGFDGDASKAYEKEGLSAITTRVINFVDVVPLGWPNLMHPNADRLFLSINGKYWLNPDPMKMVFNQWQRFSAQESNGYEGDTRETSDHDLVNYIKTLSIHALDDTMSFEELSIDES